MSGNQLVENSNAGVISVSKQKNVKTLYPHQIEAIRSLNTVQQKDFFRGILVLPTGGGKTMTAIRWALREVIGNNKKVIWIAHRHQLLDQAFESVLTNTNRQVVPYRNSFSYRIISGIHDKAVNISADDDFIIASKDSLNHGKDYFKNWVRANQNNIVLIIDEAHHAPAKSYRQIIDMLEEENDQWFQMLGLTATPDRTCEKERGILKKIFSDDIVYNIDLKALIARGILSEPIFKELKTRINVGDGLTDRDIKKILALDNLPHNIAESIVKNAERNNMIVGHYLKNKKKYGQMLLFAIDISHAIALAAIFKNKGISSDYIVSSIVNMDTGVLISPEDNVKKIQSFKNGEIQVLINVNILTEGTDLPNVQSVFLTRPTRSTILMTQMIGRGLRGLASGGTEKAYIVSFIDDWQDKINWVNPKKLIEMENSQMELRDNNKRSYIQHLVAIEKIEEFARMTDDSIDTSRLEKLDFIERVPVGLYSFSILMPSDNGEEYSKNCDIIVYDSFKQPYEEFINDLELIFKENNLEEKELLDESEMLFLCSFVESEYFEGYHNPINYKAEDIRDVLRYYASKNLQPDYLAFDERQSLNLGEVASKIWSKNMGIQEKSLFTNKLWENKKSFWKTYFGQNKKMFINQLNLEITKISNPEIYSDNKLNVIPEKITMEKLTLIQIKEKDPLYWRELTNFVYKKAKDSDGYYHSAKSDYKSKNKIEFQIDHIVPISKGGLTIKENLQLLTRRENMEKSDRLEQDESVKTLENSEYEVLESREKSESNLEVLINGEMKLYEKSKEYLDKEEYEKALEEISKAIVLNDHESDFYLQRGRCYSGLGKRRKAKKDYRLAIKLDKNNALVHYHLGYELYYEGDYLESNKSYQKFTQMKPDDSRGFNNIGVNFQALGDRIKALEYYKKALEVDPTSKVVKDNKERLEQYIKEKRRKDKRQAEIKRIKEKRRNIKWD